MSITEAQQQATDATLKLNEENCNFNLYFILLQKKKFVICSLHGKLIKQQQQQQ